MTVLKTFKNEINERKWVMLSVGIAAGILYFAYGSHKNFKETIISNFNNQQVVLLNSFQNFIRDHIDEARQNLEFIAKNIKNHTDTAEVPGIISAIYDSHQDDFFSISLLNDDGELQFTIPQITGQNPINAVFIKETVQKYNDKAAPFISERYINRDGRNAICIFVPFPAAVEKTYFVMGIIKIEDLIKDVFLTGGDNGICFFLADGEGDLFCMVDVDTYHADMIKGNIFVLDDACLSCHKQDDFHDIKQAVEKKAIINRVYEYPNAEITNRTTAAFQVYNERWSMSVCSPYEDIQGAIDSNFNKLLLYSLLFILVVGFFGYFTYKTQKRKAVLVAERDNLKKIAETSEALRESEERLRQARKMEAIGTLAGGIAHDFNNVFGAIMGYTELSLGELPEESPVKNMLKKVMGASERARDMVKQILAFSRKNLIEKKSLYIGQIIREDLKLLRSSIPATIEIHSYIEKELNPVLADLTQVHQVIMSICINAAHAMREQGGILEITLKETDLQPGTFDLGNVGPGIPVVLCTGFSEEINEENFKSRGISAFVMKPILREQIARVIREVLD